MKDEERILSNALVTYGAKLIAGAVGFVMVPYLLHSLGESEYGVMGVCWSILGFMMLVEMGIRPAVGRQFANALFRGEVDRSNEVASTALAFYGLIASGMVLAVAIGGRQFVVAMNVPEELRSEGAMALLLTATSAGLTLIGVPFMAALFSQLRHDVEQYVGLTRGLIAAAAIVAVFELSGPGIVKWALVNAVAGLGAFWIFTRQARRHCPTLRIGVDKVSRRGFDDIASFGAYTTLIGAAAWVNMQSGPLVISRLLGTAAVAHFSPVVGIMGIFAALQTAFMSPLRSFLTKAHATGDEAVIRRVLIRSTRYSLVATGGAVLLLAALAYPFVQAWLGEGFEDTAQVLALWALGWLFQAGTGASYGIYVGTGRLRLLTAVNVGIALLSLCLGVYLVGWTSWGVVGVAWGMFAAQLIRSVCFFFYSAYLCSVGRWQYLREGFVGPVACLLPLGAIAYALQARVELKPIVEVLVAGGVAGAVYLPLVWWVGLVDDDRRRASHYLARLRARLPGWRQRGESRSGP